MFYFSISSMIIELILHDIINSHNARSMEHPLSIKLTNNGLLAKVVKHYLIIHHDQDSMDFLNILLPSVSIVK